MCKTADRQWHLLCPEFSGGSFLGLTRLRFSFSSPDGITAYRTARSFRRWSAPYGAQAGMVVVFGALCALIGIGIYAYFVVARNLAPGIQADAGVLAISELRQSISPRGRCISTNDRRDREARAVSNH